MRNLNSTSGVMLITVACFLLFTVSVYSQPLSTSHTNGINILQLPKKASLGLKNISLLDPARFTMKHQYMMSFSSIGGSGTMMNMYLNNMEYQFNIPLTMRLRVAYQSQSAQLFGSSQAYSGQPYSKDGRLFIPSFDLEYRPFKNTIIGIYFRDYSSMSPDYYNPYGSSSRYNYWGHSPFMR